MGNSPSSGHGGEEDHVQRDIDGNQIGERPTKDKQGISKSDSNENPVSNPLHNNC